MPESFPQVDVEALCELDYPAMAAAILREYLTDYDPDFLAGAAAQTYGAGLWGQGGLPRPGGRGDLGSGAVARAHLRLQGLRLDS